MGWIVPHTVLLAISANHLPVSHAREKGKPQGPTCPFPLPKSIEPCTCHIESALQVDIICNTRYNNVSSELIRKLTDSFGPKNDVREFKVNLGDNKWLENFSDDTIGKFRISKLYISDGSISGNFFPGAFHEKLEEIQVLRASDTNARINSGAFANLPNLKKVLFPSTVSSIAPGAFLNLPSLYEIDLSHNWNLKKIEDDIFTNLPKLQKLDLSNNRYLCHLGNMFSSLKPLNPDMVVNLEGTNVNILLEEVFRPLVEAISLNQGKGNINMKGVRLQCGCDSMWLHATPYHGVFLEAICQDGTPLDQVDWNLLQSWCPPSNTTGYDAGYGQMYPFMLASEDKGSVEKIRENQSPRFQQNYTISATKGPVEISFEYLEINQDRWGFAGHLGLTDGDGTVILANTRGGHRGENVVGKKFTSNTDTVHVQFYSPSRECGRGCSSRPDKFKLKWQGKGGYVNKDRLVFCECCN